MNEQLLALLGIDSELSIEDRLAALEEKQYEYIEREQSTNDVARKEELTDLIHKIEKEIDLLKDSLKEINSGIILDKGEEEVSSVSDTAKVPDKKEKDSEIDQRIQALKQKEAEKKAAAVAEASSDEPEDFLQDNGGNSFANNDSSDDGFTISSSITLGNDRFKKAVTEFNSGNHNAAMKIFEELAKEGNMDAQYLVGGMYLFSKDIPNDPDRGLFWLKKAADQGHTTAQQQYGVTTIINAGNNSKKMKEGFKYLGLAADNGDQASMKDYVNYVLQFSSIKSYIKKAIKYCKSIKQTTNDPYEAEQCKGFIKELKKRKKGSSGGGCFGGCLGTLIKWFIILSLISYVIMYIGVQYDSKKNADKDKKQSETQESQKKLGEEIIEAHNLIPTDSVRLTLECDYGYEKDGVLWDGAFVYRAGNGDTTAYAVYELEGAFETLSLEVTDTFGTGNFFNNSTADFMLINAETGGLLLKKTITSETGVIKIEANITGVNKLKIAVKQTSSGLGDLAYVLVRNVFFYPDGQGMYNSQIRINGNIRENAGTEFAVLRSVSGEEVIATGSTIDMGEGEVWYEIYTDEAKTQTGWVHSSIIIQ